MCPGTKCGPLCDTEDPSCIGSNNYDPYYGIPLSNQTLNNSLDPFNLNCPPFCCDRFNEYCFRKKSSSGYEVEVDQEIMLVFGGITELDLKINGKELIDECEEINCK
jgi:hypothetical protein